MNTKAIITNKTNTAAHVVKFHEGRGSQEKIFGEAKSQAQMDYIPAKRRAANEAFLLAGLQQNLWVKFRICSGNAGRRVPLPLDPRTAETTCFMG